MHQARGTVLLALIAAFALSGCFADEGDDEADDMASTSNAVVATEQDFEHGTYLVDSDGMTLYTFVNDGPAISHCTGQCAQLWPPLEPTDAPLTALGAAGTLDIMERDDGIQQVTYDGMPLYTYSGDEEPGDLNGDGVAGVWDIATA